MPKIKKNVIIRGLSGMFGKQIVFRHMRDGRTIVAAPPDFSRRVLSEGQEAHISKFKNASAYAKDASKSNPVYAQLAAGTPRTAYNVAMADFFHAPVIHAVERVESGLRIRASDDVMVVGVRVTILDDDENVLEKGDAVQEDPSTRSGSEWWTYVPQHVGRVLVEARDLAGGVGIMKDEG